MLRSICCFQKGRSDSTKTVLFASPVRSTIGTPALFTRMSTGPRSRLTVDTIFLTCSRSRTSACTARAIPPAASISFATFWARSSKKSLTATLTPSAARRLAMPLPAP